MSSATTAALPKSYWTEIIQNKRCHSDRRGILSQALLAQYQGLSLEDAVLNNIHRLKENNTFTITTGQQIVTALGPWMVLYKIATAIKLAKDLSGQFPNQFFVPVFWMATEDHDWIEIAELRKGPAHLRWNSSEGGAVGRLTCETTLSALKEWNVTYPQYTIDEAVLKVYDEQKTLAAATRELVNMVFGHLGLVVVDGDDSNLKQLAVELFERELGEQLLFHLAEKYNAVQGEIEIKPYNLFVLSPGKRERISDKQKAQEMLATGNHTSWSPNVALRIFYQETILPNLAYVGGPSEQKYWRQVMPFFEDLKIPAPAFVLRERGVMIPEKWVSKWDNWHWDKNLCLTPKECFDAELAAKYGEKEVLEDLRVSIVEAYEAHYAKIEQEDPTLLNPAKGDCVRSIQMVEQLEKKIQRARKRKEEETLQFVERWALQVMPKDHLAERWDGWIFEWQKNKHIVDVLVEQIEWEDPSFKIWSF